MNHYNALSNLGLFLWLGIWGVLMWFAADMRSILKTKQERHRLEMAGRWDEVEKFFQRTAKTYRPFVWLFQRYLLPGTNGALYGLFLFKHGRSEEALIKLDEAIKQIEKKPLIFRPFYGSATFKIYCSALRGRALVLNGMGRYDEVRQEARRLEEMTGSRSNAALALTEYNCGNLQQALVLAEMVEVGDNQYDAMRVLVARIHRIKGNYDHALQALSYHASDVSKFYSTEGMQAMRATPEGAVLVDLHRRKLAGVFPPGRLLALASVYLDQDAIEDAERTLDEVGKSIGPLPGLQASYHACRARLLVAQGKPVEAENCLAQMRFIVKQSPKSSLIYDTHYESARTYFNLGRFGDALREIIEADRFALHPIQKHAAAFRTAQIHEALGNKPEAVSYYQKACADAIPTLMCNQAMEALNRLR